MTRFIYVTIKTNPEDTVSERPWRRDMAIQRRSMRPCRRTDAAADHRSWGSSLPIYRGFANRDYQFLGAFACCKGGQLSNKQSPTTSGRWARIRGVSYCADVKKYRTVWSGMDFQEQTSLCPTTVLSQKISLWLKLIKTTCLFHLGLLKNCKKVITTS